MSIRRRGMGRFARRKAERRLAVLGCIVNYFVSRWSVCRRRKGLNFFFSSRLGVRGLFLFRVVMYREAGFPSAFVSVHSRITISCAIQITPSPPLARPYALLPLRRPPFQSGQM